MTQLTQHSETIGTRGWNTIKEIDFIKPLMYIGHPKANCREQGTELQEPHLPGATPPPLTWDSGRFPVR